MINFISGEKFQKLADFQYKYDGFIIPKKNCILYCDTDDKFELLNQIKQNLNNKYIVISHNSDYGIDDNFAQSVPNNVVKWFAQNCDTDPKWFPRFVGIPIGLANSKWPHGDFTVIHNINLLNFTKNHFAYLSANVWTNPNKRSKVLEYCVLQPWCKTELGNTERHKFLHSINTSYFTFCPPGNGIDTCRLWESLYLNSIPIVEESNAINHFNNIFMIKYSNINDITEKYLMNQYNNFINSTNNNRNLLTMEYWIDKIYSQKHMLNKD